MGSCVGASALRVAAAVAASAAAATAYSGELAESCLLSCVFHLVENE